MATITQDMKYKQSLMRYAAAHGVSKASRKYNRERSRNSGCLGKNHNSCDGWRQAPGPCYDDSGIKDASHCIGL